ncbi:E3 ubiquitin/ISG15 ligase TRIM25-like [Engystomops pustulosus]|uniref:E3 ubiquitin/ISG15 ligase TRIM25-like n=1 Tax=Engystomops pustulosus TaxID=76066 RepID=UPI003AFB0B8F
MASGMREELLCAVCLSIFTNPVTMRCGHNFCRDCIDQVLDTQDGSGVYSCPECRAEFQERPALQRNITLCNVVQYFLSSRSHQEEVTGICCTYCIHSPVPAVKSCLHCEASQCDNHLRVHSKGPEHVLTDPSTSLENRKCPVHKKILEYYCTEDSTCICVSCCLAGGYRGHVVETLDEAFEKKNKELRNVLQSLMTRRDDIEIKVQRLEEKRRQVQEKASREAEKVIDLFTDNRRQVDDWMKAVLREISRQEMQVSLSLSDMIQRFGIEKDELSRKMRHIEELCNMTDPLTVLQEPDMGDLCDPEEEGGDEDTGRHDGGDEDTGGHDGGDEDTGGHDGGHEDTGGHDGGDEDTGGHDGGDGDIGGHDGHEEDTGGHDGGGHDGGDEDTWGHDGGDEDTGGHDMKYDVDVDVITEMLHAGFSDIGTYLQTISPAKPQPLSPSSLPSHTPQLSVSGTNGGDDLVVRTGGFVEIVRVLGEGEVYADGPADILLNRNTAGNNLLISDDQKTATRIHRRQNYPETAERFQYNQVIGSGFHAGRHYWDVEVIGSWRWRVGMCYPTIDRRELQSYIGYNNKSWCLCRGMYSNNQYSLIHDSKVIQLPHQIGSNGFRICLDYEAGKLSFYELCDPIRHLHTFTTTFTEPLHAVLGVWDGCINIEGE